MKIAVACDGLDIAVTAATCSSFACYTAQSGVVTGCSNVPNMGITPRERASILQQMGVDALIARQFSPEGLAALDEAGIGAAVAFQRRLSRARADGSVFTARSWEEGLSEGIKKALGELDDAFARIDSSSPKPPSPRSHSPQKRIHRVFFIIIFVLG